MEKIENGVGPEKQIPENVGSPRKEIVMLALAASVLILGLAAVVVYGVLTQPKDTSREVSNQEEQYQESSPSAGTGFESTDQSAGVTETDEINDIEKDLENTELDSMEEDFSELEDELEGL